MEALAVALAWGGPVVVAGAWVAVRRDLVSIWVAVGVTVGPLGLLALATGDLRAASTFSPGAAAGLGLAAGLALYLATAAFMFVFRRWSVLRRHADAVYAWREGLPLWATIAIAALVVAPGEEALWRGIVQGRLAGLLGEAGAAAAAWGVYVAVNAVPGSVPILLGGVVGGAAWGGLAWWTGGVLAGACCHLVWTGLMIARPPVFEAASP